MQLVIPGLALLAGGASSVITGMDQSEAFRQARQKRSEVNLTRSLSAPFIAGIEALVAIALNWLETRCDSQPFLQAAYQVGNFCPFGAGVRMGLV